VQVRGGAGAAGPGAAAVHWGGAQPPARHRRQAPPHPTPPPAAQALINRGKLLRKTCRLAEAEADFNQVLEMRPEQKAATAEVRALPAAAAASCSVGARPSPSCMRREGEGRGGGCTLEEGPLAVAEANQHILAAAPGRCSHATRHRPRQASLDCTSRLSQLPSRPLPPTHHPWALGARWPWPLAQAPRLGPCPANRALAPPRSDRDG
jgi:hypothetical protein